MRIDGIIVPLVMSIVLAGCTARINVTHVQPTTKPVRDGVFKDPTESLRGTIYALPRTVVKVKLPIEKTAKSPGKYGAYADLFLPDRKPIVPPGSPAESTLALKRATFSTAGEPDPDNVYAVELAKGGALDQDLTVELTEQGSISGVDVRVENQTSDIILSAISAASGIASRALIAGGAACPADPTFDEFLDCNSLRQSFNGLDQVRRDTLKARYATMADFRGAEPPPPALLASSCGAAKKKAELFFRLDSEPTGEQLAAMIRRNYKDPIDPGLRYRIPARMKVTLEIEGTPAPVAEIRLMIAQFGMVAALPATVDSKTINSRSSSTNRPGL